MKNLKSYILLSALAGTAIWCGSCNLGTHREESARLRLEQKMAEARITAAHDLLAAGYTEQANRILKPYLPAIEEHGAVNEPAVAAQPAPKQEKQQFAKADPQPEDEPSVW